MALFQQQADGSLIDVTEMVGLAAGSYPEPVPMSGVSVGDLNEDGYLDVLIPYFGEFGLYLENQKNGRFKKIFNNFDRIDSKGWTPIIYDLDRDGWNDYYQAMDFGFPNQFWKHSGDLDFIESANMFNLDSKSDDMGITLGDYDKDGNLDIYISNIENEVKGNILLRHEGDFIFSDRALECGVQNGGWGWGVTFMDGNNDGLLDIAATNGFNYGFDQSKYWLNDGDGNFMDVSLEVAFNDTLMATALISLDIDRDGDLDLIQTINTRWHSNGFRILKNELEHGSDKNYLVVQPRMEGPNHWAIGSLVRIVTQNGDQIRPITAGISYFGQEPAEAFFGLGDLENVDRIEVEWPGGAMSVIENVSANQVIVVNDNDALHPPRNLQVSITSESGFMLNWDASSTTETSYIIEKSTFADFSDYEEWEIASENTEYIDNEVSEGEIYYYRVKAKRDMEISRSSLHVLADLAISIENPADIQIEKKSSTSVEINWVDRSDNEEGFLIQRSNTQNFDLAVNMEVGANRTSYSDNGLEPNSVYYYRIQAYNQGYVSDFSEIVMVDLSTFVLSTEDVQELSLYPNPTEGRINFTDTELNGIEEIKLFDSQLKTITTLPVQSSIDVSRFLNGNGIYYIKMSGSSGNINFYKIIAR